MGKDVVGFTPDALRALDNYDFPGNVRELENVIERAVALAGSRAIGLGDLPREVSGAAAAPGPTLLELPPDGLKLDDVLGEVERRMLSKRSSARAASASTPPSCSASRFARSATGWPSTGLGAKAPIPTAKSRARFRECGSCGPRKPK